MDAITNLINQIDTWVWGWWMILLLLGTHIFMTIRTGVIQRKIGTAIKLSVTKDPDGEGEVSQFGALTTALASTIGTGNIIGVGTAIALGGPGAVLWCWLTGVFGIATKYSESLIAVKYRVKTKDGRMQGGAMYALERGLHMKWLGLIFAIFGGFASFGIGCATQVNAIATVCQENLHIPPAAVGIAVAVLTALVIFGGIKAIANVCEKLVPFMAAFYVVGCFIILCINYDFIIPAVVTICKMAFTPGAAAGGLVGRGIMMAFFKRVRYGLGTDRSGSSTDEKSGPSGSGFQYRYILGYRCCMSDDRTGTCHQYHEKSGNRYGTDHKWWCPDYAGISADSGSRTGHPRGWHYFLCIFYCTWMGILRRTLCGIFCRKKRPCAISCPLHSGSCDRTGYFIEPCLDDRGYSECTDGTSEPCGGIASVECDCGGDEKIYQ